MALPQLQDFSENDIMSHFSNPECVAVVPRDPQKQTISLPPYLVESVSIVDFLEAKHALCSNEALDLKIMDFGNGKSAFQPIFALEIVFHVCAWPHD